MLIEVQNLEITLGLKDRPLRLVRDVTLGIEAGTIHGMIGESGSGKSITGMSMLGLLPEGARIAARKFHFDGIDLAKNAQDLRGTRISLISQDPAAALNPVLTIGKQIKDVLKAHGVKSSQERQRMALELLEATRLPDCRKVMRSYPHELSGGMQQRVVIAQALATGAEFLIADEPTTALDKTIAKQILTVLKSLVAGRGLTVLLITHDMDVIAESCTRASVLYAGATVEDGRADEILSDPKHPYTRALLNARPARIPKESRLATIDGHPKKPAEVQTGCLFSDRCPWALPMCSRSVPKMRRQGDRNWSCHLDDGDAQFGS